MTALQEHLTILSKRELYRLLAWINAVLSGQITVYGIALMDKFEDDKDLVEHELNCRLYKNRT